MLENFLIENRVGSLIWKASNLWQLKLRKILKPFNLSTNEYLILEAAKILLNHNSNVCQNEIAKLTQIDITVVSVKLKLLERKKFISRSFLNDNRKKIIKVLKSGDILIDKISPIIDTEEYNLFNKLNNENFNFTNSLKLLLGKKIRIKAETLKNIISYDTK